MLGYAQGLLAVVLKCASSCTRSCMHPAGGGVRTRKHKRVVQRGWGFSEQPTPTFAFSVEATMTLILTTRRPGTLRTAPDKAPTATAEEAGAKAGGGDAPTDSLSLS